jgi:branched-chain amino acid transport system substrate-binding protein
MIPDDRVYGNRLAGFCLKQGYKRSLVYQQIGTAGRDLANAFVVAAEEAGIAILYRQKYDSFTTRKDFQKLLLRSNQRYQFDAILLAGQFPQSGIFIDTARKMGIEKPIIGGVALERTKLLKMIAPKTGNVFMPTTFDPDSTGKGVRRFVEAFKKRYGKAPDTMAAQAYDTVHTLAYAIKQAGSTAPPKMAEALHSTKGLEGLAGPISFDDQGNRLGTNIAIKVIKNGRFEYLPSEDSSLSGISK